MIRESYRERCWTRFRKGKRRAAQLVASTPYNEKQCQAVRKQVEDDEVLRCLAQGGFSSPAIMQRPGCKLPMHCPWCRSNLGYLDHIMWECSARPTKLRRPKSEMSARLGWPDPSRSAEQNAEYAIWQRDVVEEVWRQRYGEDRQRKAWQEEKHNEAKDNDEYSGSSGD